MSFDWRAKREAAIMNRRREGRWPSEAGAIYVNRPLQEVRNDFWFYYRWAYDNVIEMLCRADTEFKGQLAGNLYTELMTARSNLSRYQDPLRTLPELDGEDED